MVPCVLERNPQLTVGRAVGGEGDDVILPWSGTERHND